MWQVCWSVSVNFRNNKLNGWVKRQSKWLTRHVGKAQASPTLVDRTLFNQIKSNIGEIRNEYTREKSRKPVTWKFTGRIIVGNEMVKMTVNVQLGQFPHHIGTTLRFFGIMSTPFENVSRLTYWDLVCMGLKCDPPYMDTFVHIVRCANYLSIAIQSASRYTLEFFWEKHVHTEFRIFLT